MPTFSNRPDASPAPLPPTVRAAVDALHAHLVQELGPRIEASLDAAQRDLHGLGQASSGPVVQAHWQGNLRRLIEHRSRLWPRLLSELRKTLDGLREPPVQSRPAPAPGLQPLVVDDLRLVEDDEVDEAGLIDELGRRQEVRAGLPLLLLGQRFGVLAASPAFTAGTLPVGPRGLASTFLGATGELQLDADARKVLLRAFERTVLKDYPGLADSMNAVLGHAGVLPGLSYVPLRPRPASGPAPAPAPASSGTARGRYQATLGAAPALAEDRRLAQMRQWMAERRHLLSRLSGSAGSPPPQAMGPQELDNVLAALQVGPVELRSTARLREAVQAQARRLDSEATLGPVQADALALFGELYMRLHERLDPSGHPLLAGLQMPLLRLAMRDPGFLVRPSTAPRRLLSTVVEATAGHLGHDGLDHKLLRLMQDVVNALTLQYPHDTAVFEQACSALEESVQASLRRAEIAERRNIEAARGRERLLAARRDATAALEWAIGDQDPPRFLRSLLEQAWADALSLVALRNGTGSQQWHDYMDTTAAISRAIREGEPTTAEHAERAREALGLIGYHPEQALAIASHLTGTGNPDQDPASRTELVLEMKERSRLGGQTTAPAPALPVSESPRRAGGIDWEARLKGLPDGQWVEFDAPGRPGSTLRLRLAWRGEDSERVLLLNARGQPAADPPAHRTHELAHLLASGQARLLGEYPPEVLEQVWRSMVAELQPQSAESDLDFLDGTEWSR